MVLSTIFKKLSAKSIKEKATKAKKADTGKKTKVKGKTPEKDKKGKAKADIPTKKEKIKGKVKVLVKGKGKKAKKGKKEESDKPKTQEELDEEMAMYWFKAGKGPDPTLAKLDKEMDDYRSMKKDGGEGEMSQDVVTGEVERAA